VFDGGIGGACPANHMFFLNTDYIYLRPHSEAPVRAARSGSVLDQSGRDGETDRMGG
jgi:hypothetical protein